MKWNRPSARRRSIVTALSFALLTSACGGREQVRPDAADATSAPSVASTVPHVPQEPSAAAALSPAGGSHRPVDAGALNAVVYQTPTCGCCGKWVDHARAHGITAEVRMVDYIDPVKRQYTIPASVQSCHTTLIGGYIVEGHVPADVIRQLLRERPAVRGIAAPGMPLGSPGMEGPYSQRYDIVTFDERGPTGVFARR